MFCWRIIRRAVAETTDDRGTADTGTTVWLQLINRATIFITSRVTGETFILSDFP